jgi:hypothetical protein
MTDEYELEFQIFGRASLLRKSIHCTSISGIDLKQPENQATRQV